MPPWEWALAAAGAFARNILCQPLPSQIIHASLAAPALWPDPLLVLQVAAGCTILALKTTIFNLLHGGCQAHVPKIILSEPSDTTMRVFLLRTCLFTFGHVFQCKLSRRGGDRGCISVRKSDSRTLQTCYWQVHGAGWRKIVRIRAVCRLTSLKPSEESNIPACRAHLQIAARAPQRYPTPFKFCNSVSLTAALAN